MENAKESKSLLPFCHSLNPAGMDRQADPDPRRARRERSISEISSPMAVTAARVRAAKPEAEEAIPAPVGKLFSLRMWAWVEIPRSPRSRFRCLSTRSSAAPDWRLPLRSNISIGNEVSKVRRVRVSSSARFIEIEPFSGRRNAWSRLPQYLMKAMFG